MALCNHEFGNIFLKRGIPARKCKICKNIYLRLYKPKGLVYNEKMKRYETGAK